jgi:DNA sulfur modification protein DndC
VAKGVRTKSQVSTFDEKPIEAFYDEVCEVYRSDDRPWVLGYSGGKDSTATLQLVWMALARLKPKERQKPVYVISSDTYVETPVIVDHIDTNLDKINEASKKSGMPFEASKVVPELDHTFWVNLIGRGYPAPSNKFRWCTDRMKIQPANKFILDRVADFGEVVMVLGVRSGESATRDQVMNNYAIKGSRLRRHRSLTGAFVYSPIEEFNVDDVWKYLLAVKSPWGVKNRKLVAMYRNAQSGECPLVVDTSTPSCGNSRFGCWVCTVVDRDSSMESMVENGEDWMQALLDFRDSLASHKDPQVKRKLRQYKRRNGRVTQKPDGTLIPGPYKPDVRRDLLRQLLETQEEVRRTGPDPKVTLISDAELREIRRIWQQELQDWEDSVPQIYREVTGQELECVHDDVANFTIQDKQLLDAIADGHGLSGELVGRLLDVEREKHGMSRRAGIFDRIESILREDWYDEDQLRELYKVEVEEQEEVAE